MCGGGLPCTWLKVWSIIWPINQCNLASLLHKVILLILKATYLLRYVSYIQKLLTCSSNIMCSWSKLLLNPNCLLFPSLAFYLIICIGLYLAFALNVCWSDASLLCLLTPQGNLTSNRMGWTLFRLRIRHCPHLVNHHRGSTMFMYCRCRHDI